MNNTDFYYSNIENYVFNFNWTRILFLFVFTILLLIQPHDRTNIAVQKSNCFTVKIYKIFTEN